MNTKTIYAILAVIVIAFLGYYFINNQSPTSQLPINNNTDEPTVTEPVQNEPGDTVPPVASDEYLTYVNNAYGFSVDYPKDWYWNATAEIQDFECKIWQLVDSVKPCGDGGKAVVYFSNWSGGYCGAWGCIDTEFEASPTEKAPMNLEYLTIYSMGDDAYAKATKSKTNSDFREYELITKDGVSIHSYRSVKKTLDDSNSEYAYWSYNGNNFKLSMLNRAGITMTNKAIETYRQMLNSLSFR